MRRREMRNKISSQKKAAKKALTRGNDARFCILCEENHRSVLFFPCAHFAVCEDCDAELDECPCEGCGLAIEDRLEDIKFAL
jgi:hypothetical protein